MSAVPATLNEINADARYNIYTVVHKGLRAFMVDTLLRLGRLDTTDTQALVDTLNQARDLLSYCAQHVRHENEHLHPAMERARNGSAARTALDHVDHELAIAQLGRDLDRIDASPASRRAALVHRFYRTLSGFIADNFEHMLIEETDNHRELAAAYDDAEVMAIEQAIVASLTPQEALRGLRWMIPSINHQERAAMLNGMKRHAPRDAFAAVLDLAREHLPAREYEKLTFALGE